MKQYIRAGGALDILTKSELQETMGHQFDAAIRDILRGVDYLAFSGNGNGTGTFTIPYSPESGYVWSLKLIGAQLSAAGEMSVYPASNINVAPIATAPTFTNGANFEAVAHWTSNVVVLKDNRQLTLYSASANILNYVMYVKAVPAEMQGKL